MFAFGERTRGFMHGVHPDLINIADAALLRSPVDFGCTEKQVRTLAEQAEKVRLGFSRSLNGPHVVKADGFGHALDLVPWIDGRFTWGDNQWRVKTQAGVVLEPFFDIAIAMRASAKEHNRELIWGGVWDRKLSELPGDPVGLRAAIMAYNARHPGSDLNDLPHFQLA